MGGQVTLGRLVGTCGRPLSAGLPPFAAPFVGRGGRCRLPVLLRCASAELEVMVSASDQIDYLPAVVLPVQTERRDVLPMLCASARWLPAACADPDGRLPSCGGLGVADEQPDGPVAEVGDKIPAAAEGFDVAGYDPPRR